MPTQIQHADIFHRLHAKCDPVVLFDVWDAGTAQVVASAGCPLRLGRVTVGSSA